MANTKAYWKAILEAEKATFGTLASLVTGTKAWQGWLDICAEFTRQAEEIYESRIIDVEAQADLVQKYTQEWYRTMMLKYQDGDQVKKIGNEWTYDTIDTDKQTVKACVVHQGVNNLLYPQDYAVSAHLATINASGDYEIISSWGGPGQYLDKIKAMGSVTQVTNNLWTAVTNLNVQGTIYYDPTILTNSGALISDTTVFPVNDAINSYVDNYVNVTGYLRNFTLLEYIRQATGVVDVSLTNQRYDQAGGTTYTDVTREFYNKRVTQYLISGSSSLTFTSI